MAPIYTFAEFLRPDHQVRIGFRLTDSEPAIELNAVVINIDNDILYLETFESNSGQLAQIPVGTPAIILSSENWAFCRCQGVLSAAVARDFTIKLRGEPEVQQRREYFRMDVYIPIAYSVAEDQQLSVVEGMWKARRILGEFGEPPRTVPFQGSFKVLDWNDGQNIDPCRVNLSGGGMKIKTPQAFTSGALLNLDIFLPLSPLRVIAAVGSVIRSNEIRLTLDNRPAYATAMRFVFMSEKDCEYIITYIFNEQRNSLRPKF